MYHALDSEASVRRAGTSSLFYNTLPALTVTRVLGLVTSSIDRGWVLPRTAIRVACVRQILQKYDARNRHNTGLSCRDILRKRRRSEAVAPWRSPSGGLNHAVFVQLTHPAPGNLDE